MSRLEGADDVSTWSNLRTSSAAASINSIGFGISPTYRIAVISTRLMVGAWLNVDMNYNYEYSTIHGEFTQRSKHKADATPIAASWLDRTRSPMQAIFHLLNPFLSLHLAVFSNRLPGSLAQVSEVYGNPPDSFSDP